MTTPVPSPVPTDANLGGSAIADGTDASQGSAYVLQVYCQTVLQTPSLVPPLLPGVPADPALATQLATDLATAQTHASYYLHTLNPQLTGLSAQIVAYANQWAAMYSQLLTDAGNINDPASRSDFIEGINLLINKAHLGKTKSAQASTALTTFYTDDLSADIAAFAADYDAVNAIYGTGSLEEQQLQAAIDACNKGMTTNLIVMGGSAVLLLAGGAAILIGLLGEIESAGLSTVLVVGGFALVAGSAVAGTVAATNWVSENKTLANATTALTAAQAICATTQQTMNNIQSISSACVSAGSAALALSNTWGSLADDLSETAQALGTAEYNIDSSYLVSMLNAANADWLVALSLAEQLQGGNATLAVGTAASA